MKLRDVVEALPTLDEALCIVAKRPWSAACEVQVVPFTPEYLVPQAVLDSGYEYFLGGANGARRRSEGDGLPFAGGER